VDDLGLRATYGVGTTNRQRGVVTYSPHAGDGRDFLALEAVHDDGFGENRGIDRLAALGRQRLLDSPAHGTLSLLGAAYRARFALPGAVRDDDLSAGRTGFYDSYDPAGRGDSRRGLAGLSYDWSDGASRLSALAFGGYRELELLENFTGFLIDPVNGDRRLQRQTGWSFGADALYRRRLAAGLELSAGAGLRGDQIDQSQSQLDREQAVIEVERSLEASQRLAHLRADLRWQPDPALSVTVGGRADRATLGARDALAAGPDGGAESSGTLTTLSPRVSVDAALDDQWSAFAAYGRGFRPPEARAFSTYSPEQTGLSEELYAGGRPALTVADVLEIGARFDWRRALAVQAAAFGTFIERESIYDHVSGVSLELNGTRLWGVELELEARPHTFVELHADATLVDARFAESGNRVPLVPWLVTSAQATLSSPDGLGLRASLRGFGLAPRPLPHGARGESLVRLDATAGYHFAALRIDVELENVLGRRLREGEYHYASNFRPDDPASQLPVLHYVAGPPFNARLSLTLVY
jgi:outer membrane receptor protein involved in Fe transport